jgi:bla regulator protein BlaR1
MDDLIDIMQKYGAYNAANLDGGTSSVLVVGETIVNDPIDSTGAHKTRPISTGFILVKDDSDDSDHSVVEDKLNK